MASNQSSSHPPRQLQRTTCGQGSSASASLLLEKTKANIRRSTPDSEALASSDDEQEHQQRSAPISSQSTQKTVRRSSLFNDNQGISKRRTSTNGSDSFLSAASQGTSNPDANTWANSATGMTRSSVPSASFPWASGIWTDHQKGPPARLAEVLPSPTNHGSSMFNEEVLSTPLRRDSTTEAAIPFAIPLHPTLKAYRSQSYSVGQLDQETIHTSPKHVQSSHSNRTRAGSSYSGLQHRPSRPSMRGDFSPDTSILGQLREVDDDDETSNASSEAGVRLANGHVRTIEQLAMENAILRQQAYGNHSATGKGGGTIGLRPLSSQSMGRSGGRYVHTDESVLEEAEDFPRSPTVSSGFHSLGQSSASTLLENRVLEHVKKAHWQSSLGFGGVIEAPQSRRHSFADISLRNSKPASNDEGQRMGYGEAQPELYTESLGSQARADSTSYFSNHLFHTSDVCRSPGSPTARSAHNGSYQTATPAMRAFVQATQQLYLVTFKAARAEFYYVQEGTGLDVNAGDLVIVEADRGTDLGTVAHKNIDWASAKHLKERYVLEHYNWLMLFSRQGQAEQPNSTHSSSAISAGARSLGSTLGGMGSQGYSSLSDTGNIEVKPKMIKRLAQPHEIHMLREKEGNEAKAKRMCQQKVVEHHLNMEILDAEFQMDWKKLTFYYYAEAYVNFNSLVTDLFKIYKTRIWMSAINPASFVSPTNLQPSSSVISNVSQNDHSRFADPHLRGDGPSYNDMTQEHVDVLWQDNLGAPLLTTSQGQTNYSPYFQRQSQNFSPSYNTASPSRGLFSSPYRSNSPVPYSHYTSNGIIHGTGHVESSYGDSIKKSKYSEQLSALHGLSLGP